MPRIALNNKRGSSCLYDFLLFSKQSQRLGKTPTKQKYMWNIFKVHTPKYYVAMKSLMHYTITYLV